MKTPFKRTLACILALALLAFAAGCAPANEAETPPPSTVPADSPDPAATASFSEDAALERAEEIFALIAAGDNDAVLAYADDTLKAQVTAAQIGDGWNSILAMLGAYSGSLVDNSATTQGSYTVATITGRHSGGASLLTCSFSADGLLTGLVLNVAEIASNPVELPAGVTEVPVKLFEGTATELNAMITLPADYNENTPAVLMAPGSGSHDMDVTIFANKPFRDIAYGLAAQGVASLRYDEFFYSYPELADETITIDDEYTSTILEAIKVLRDNTDIGQLFMLGHSLGGMLTPYFMEEAGVFAGGIILAGTPRKLHELSYDQSVEVYAQLPEEERAAAMAELDAEFDRVNALDALSDGELEGLVVMGMPAHYLKRLNSIDALALAHEVNKPLLILQGEDDFQVTLEKDFTAWKDGLRDMGELVTFKSYPGLSHLFMTAHGDITDITVAYGTPDTVDETVISDIAAWVLKTA